MNVQNKILIIDDEPKIVEVLKSYLEKEGYDIFQSYNGKEALELFENINPELVILDLMLPDISGEDICKIIRDKSKTPIIMLTAKVAEDSVVGGLDIGADDYITKPFSPRQVVARVKALLRRASEWIGDSNSIISFDNKRIIINTISYEVKKDGENISLTPNEYKLLVTLASYPKKVFTREELVTSALGDEYEGYDRSIDTHIKNLRQKLEDDSKNPKFILTVHGVGYKFGGERN